VLCVSWMTWLGIYAWGETEGSSRAPTPRASA
jgi:hypothetical protein